MLAPMRSGCAMAAAVLAGMLAPAARADVTVSTDRVVVDTGRARAVIDRSPFRIAFQSGHGRTVLREVAGRPHARRIPPTDDPEPFALDHAPDHPVYGPLTFVVGREGGRSGSAPTGRVTCSSTVIAAPCRPPAA